MRTIVKFAAFCTIPFIIASCSVSEKDLEPPVSTLKKVSVITIYMNGSPNFNQVQFGYNGSSAKNYRTNADGNTSISFIAKGGRSFLADFRGSSDNLISFNINSGDTLRVIEDGIKTDYITDPSGDSDSRFDLSMLGPESEETARATFLNYSSSSLLNQKFLNQP